MKTAFVTGSNGFIGAHLVQTLLSSGWRVRATTRRLADPLPIGAGNGDKFPVNSLEKFIVSDISSYSGWDVILERVDVVVHLAGLAHDTRQNKKWTSGDYKKVNAEATETIARAAARAGVKRFVFLSSIKVNGEETPLDQPFDELSPPAPKGPYSVSKYEAEKALKAVADETGLEVVIIRPPLVYGHGVKGNMRELVRTVKKRSVIPAPKTESLRSFVYVGNLVDAIKTLMESPAASGEVFTVSDGQDVSTAGLIGRIAGSMERKVVIIPVPQTLLSLAGKVGDIGQKIIGRPLMFNSGAASKIQSSLRVDSTKIREKLGWTPPHTLEEGVREMVRGMRGGRPFATWLNLYDLLAVPVAWLAASVIKYDYFLITGGLERFLFILPIVMTAQYFIYWWVGFTRTDSQDFRKYEAWDIIRVALLGSLLIVASLSLINRLYGVSRTALVLYPMALGLALSLPRILFGYPRLSKDVKSTLDSDHGRQEAAVMDDTRVEVSKSLAIEEAGPETMAGTPEPGQRVLVSVIIVNYNAGELLTECVRSVLQSSAPIEAIVSDNGSTDGSVQYLRKMFGKDSRLRIVENNANLGFARANNIVLPYATGNHILFLNPDCIIEPNTIERMERIVASNPEVGMAGCLIKNLDGGEQAGCRRMVPTPWRTFARVLHLDKLFPNHPGFRSFVLSNQPLPDRPVYIEALSGAFMFVRRETLENVGVLDDKYFMHCEDLDWCMRFRKAGWKILFAPEVEITHIKGTCSRERPIRVLWHKHRGMVRFYRKFFRRQYPAPFMWLVIASVWVRFTAITITIVFRRSLAKVDDSDIN